MTEILEKAFAATLASAAEDADAERRRAFDRFLAAGFPSTRSEDWRYTDLKPIRDREFEFAPPAPAAATLERVRARLAESGLCTSGEPCAVFVDGHHVSALSATAAAAGLAIEPLRPPAPAVAEPARAHPLAALNAAFARGAVSIRVPEGGSPEAPLHLVFVGSGEPDLAVQPRIAIELAPRAKLTVVMHFLDCGADSGWTNAVTRIVQQPGSELVLYRLQDHDAAQFHTSLVDAELGADARLEAGLFDAGGRLVRHDIDVRLAAPGAHVELYGVALAFAGQHVDNHLRIDHAAPRTFSGQAFRAIAGRQGRGVFSGKVVVHRDAQGIDARQRSDNLLLSEQAEIDTKPELEIYADNVKCSHGATVGELDEEQLFYLRARGVDEDAARGLLTFAFANAILERIGLEALRSRVADRIAARLPDHEQWEALS